MKKVLISLCLLLSAISIMAQSNSKKIENGYLSMNVPEGWEVDTPEIPGMGIEMLVFVNSGTLHNMGMVIGIEQRVDPKAALEAQMESKSNVLFANASFGDIYPTTFMGKKAEAVDFSTDFMNTHLKGAAYAFKSGECSVIAIGCYKPGVKSSLPQVWRSIQWKEHKKKTYASLKEELSTYITTFNRQLKKSPVGFQDGQLTGMACDTEKKCIIYSLRLQALSRFDYTEEQINQMKNNMQAMGVSIVKQAVASSDLLQRCAKDNYSFRYDMYDKGDNFMYCVLVTADELK